MNSIKNMIPCIVGIITILLSFSCTPGACLEETDASVKASFYLESSGKLTAPDSITLFGIGSDSLRYKKALRIQPASIPLNAAVDKVGFVLRINGISDTINFLYSSYPHLISKECGYTYYHDLDSVYATRHIIDTILIKVKSVTTLNEPNIYIYY